MIRNIVLIFFLLFSLHGCSSLNVDSNQSTRTTSMIEIKSSDIAVAIKGKGSPTVIFESGLGVNKIECTQEYDLRYLSENESSFQEIVRQQWNFSPDGNNIEKEDHQVNLDKVTELELIIIPNIKRREARDFLMQLRLA